MAPKPPTVSPVTGKPVPEHYIHSSSLNFQDNHGRSLILRGVNLSGGAKAPHNQPSWSAEGFWEDAEAGKGDFVGRPLNLQDGSADVHLARLRAWGYNFLRYVFTWEALEHEGPGKYDEAYMDYVVAVLVKCKEWGFKVFMDPHQDVWSRFSGGSGAPLWTIYACGIDPMNISPTYAALLHHEHPSREAPKPDQFPQMIWATNYTRLLSQTIWTLFFAGKTFAPKCIIDGKNIQDWLQDHFIDAVGTLVQKIAQKGGLLDECVIGWDSMNEPGDGVVGQKSINEIPKEQRLKKGPSPTAFEGMLLGMGHAVEVESWDFTQMGPKSAGKVLLDPKGVTLWLKPEEERTRGGGKWGWKRDPGWQLGTCIWAQHGVWDPESAKLLRPDYFRFSPSEPSRPADLVNDFWRLHWLSYASRIRLHHPEAIHFVQPPVFAVPPALPQSFTKGRMCTSPHYYDGLTLMTKHWNWFNADALGLLRGKYWSMLAAIRVGERNIRKCIQDQLGILKQDTREVYGDYPTLIGEIGCPYDMDDKKAYGYVDGGKGEGDYSAQQRAWDASLNAADGPNCLNYTLWTYVPDNSHEWGDLWNNEDLSIWSEDDARKTEAYTDEDDDESKADGTSTTIQPVGKSLDVDFQSSKTSTTSSSATLVPPPQHPYTPQSIASGEGVTPRLILEGSRAVGAVVRPFPTAIIGTPQRIDFDIATTTFKFSVKVSPEDTTPDRVMTEIYLPYVHYAESLEPYSRGGGGSSAGYYTQNNDDSKVSLLKGNDGTQSRFSTSANDVNDNGNFNGKTPVPLNLDVEVKVSHGDYSISGQTLYWNYPAPTEREEIYEIQVKRIGGAIVRELGWVQSGGWGDVLDIFRKLNVQG